MQLSVTLSIEPCIAFRFCLVGRKRPLWGESLR